ncbi:hypothetical protein [Rhodococcus koreensis]
MTKRPTRVVDHWTTVQVAPLPAGWVHVWRNNDGTEHTEPCPAILLQECRERENVWDLPGTYPKQIRCEDVPVTPPYDTRAVYAVTEWESALLDTPDLYLNNYVRTEYRAPVGDLAEALRFVLAQEGDTP